MKNNEYFNDSICNLVIYEKIKHNYNQYLRLAGLLRRSLVFNSSYIIYGALYL